MADNTFMTDEEAFGAPQETFMSDEEAFGAAPAPEIKLRQPNTEADSLKYNKQLKLGDKIYWKNKLHGDITDEEGNPVVDPAVLDAFGMKKPTKMGQALYDAKTEDKGLSAWDTAQSLGTGIVDRAANLLTGFLASQYSTGSRPSAEEFAKVAPWLKLKPEQVQALQSEMDKTDAQIKGASSNVIAGQNELKASIGYKSIYDPVRHLKAPFMQGNYGEALKNIPGFAAEQFVTSLPNMLAAMLAPQMALPGETGRIAMERAGNDKRGYVSDKDMTIAAPVGAAITVGERIGLGKILEPGPGLRGVVGAGLTEGGTEFVQEAAEDVASTVDTEKGWNPLQSFEMGVYGALGGAPAGSVAAIPGALMSAPGKSNLPPSAQPSPTGAPSPAPPAGPAGPSGGPPAVGQSRRAPANPIMTDRDAFGSKAPDAPPGMDVNTQPSEAQKAAGNYKKGHTKVQGLDISIENPKGTDRTSKDPANPWSVTMPVAYGYVKRTKGADGDQVDVFIADKADTSDKVFVIDQVDPETGNFDEHKAILGVDTAEEAARIYHDSYSDGKGVDRLANMVELSMDEFKTWARRGDTSKPLWGNRMLPPAKLDLEAIRNPAPAAQAAAPMASAPKAAVPEPGKAKLAPRAPNAQEKASIETGIIPASEPETQKGSRRVAEPSAPAAGQSPMAPRQPKLDNKAEPAREYTIDNPVNDDGPLKVRVVRTKGYTGINDGMGVVDVTKMLDAGMSIEQAIAETYGDHPQGSKADVSKVKPVTDQPSAPRQPKIGTEKEPIPQNNLTETGFQKTPSGDNQIPRKPIARRDVADDEAITSSGRKVPVKYAIVEAADLVASQNEDGGANPDYPAEMQPRDRGRGVSAAQVHDIASKLEPRLLDKSAKASDGAPIIADDGVVESGNGRVLAIRRAYGRSMPGAEKYRAHLKEQGYPVDGVKEPVLVRVRQGDLTDEDRQAFTREANERDTLALSATERAMADAAQMSEAVLDLYRGGDIDAAANRDFVRAFIRDVVAKNDHAGMIDADGRMSQDAVRRISGALLAKAYGDATLVAAMTESADTNIKSIGGALMDVAGLWAKMRAEAADGQISDGVDQTEHLLAAVRLVERARTQGQPLALLVGQTDIFSGQGIAYRTEAFLSLMFDNTTAWKVPIGRDRLVDALRFYIEEARKTSPGENLLGVPAASSEEILALAKKKQQKGQPDEKAQDGFDLRPASRKDTGEAGGANDPQSKPRDEAAQGGEAARNGDGEEVAASYPIKSDQVVEPNKVIDDQSGDVTEKDASLPTVKQDLQVAKPAPIDKATGKAPASWVVKQKSDGKVMFETTDAKKVAALNTEKYEAVPIGEHLASLNEPKQGAVGMMLGTGEVVLTSTGRKTSPFPAVKFDTNRKATNTVRAVERWLMQNAIDEAKARGDTFNQAQFEANLEKPSQADKDSAELYLFDKDFVTGPTPSILKPITPPANQPPMGDQVADALEADGWASTKYEDHTSFTKTFENAAPAGTVSNGTRTITLQLDARRRYLTRFEGFKEIDADLREAKSPQEAIDKVMKGALPPSARPVKKTTEATEAKVPDKNTTLPKVPPNPTPGSSEPTPVKDEPTPSKSPSDGRIEAPESSVPPDQAKIEAEKPAIKNAGYGSKNTLVSAERAAELREKLRNKLRDQLNAGIDPEMLAIGAEMAAFHIEAGARKFGDFARAMASDLGASLVKIRPYLRSWYNGARDMMEDNGLDVTGMEDAEQVKEELRKLFEPQAATEAAKPADTFRADLAATVTTSAKAAVAADGRAYRVKKEGDTYIGLGMTRATGVPPTYFRPDEGTNWTIEQAVDAVEREVAQMIRWETEGQNAFGAGRLRAAPINAWEGVSRGEGSRRAEAWLRGWDKANLAPQETDNAPGSGNVLESNSGAEPAQNDMGATDVPPATGVAGQGAGAGGSQTDATGGRPDRGGGVPQGGALIVGARGNIELPARQSELALGPATPGERERGAGDSKPGLPPDALSVAQTESNARKASDLSARREAQRAAETKPVILADAANIADTLPMLTPEQQGDVAKTEERYAKADGHGMMLTNGTGTGKTYSGLGVVKRFARRGKTNTLIIAPSQGILMDWQRSAKDMLLDIKVLDSTTDNGGSGIVLTTYANLGQNRHLVDRKWDLVVTDEAHKLSSDKDGTKTSALETFRAITGHPDGDYTYAYHVLRDEVDAFDALKARLAQLEAMNATEKIAEIKERIEVAGNKLNTKAQDLAAQYRARPREAKALMLSATPFAYHFSLDYAEGYLFQFDRNRQGSGYNSGDGRDQFYMENLGYRMRTNRLTKPEAGVNLEVMERQLHEKLKREGALAGRALEVEKDYDRKFVLVDDAVGHKIDEAMEHLWQDDDGKYRPIAEIVSDRFDYLTRMRLLEAIKARHVIPIIRKDLALGRKVVVFHDYNEGGGISPFALSLSDEDEASVYANGQNEMVKLKPLYEEFLARYPWVAKLDFSGYRAPIVALTEAFPEAMVYNGTVPNKKRDEAKRLFNADGNGKDIIIVQSAAGEAGISLHDTTGRQPRVLRNLGMPIRPTTSLQQEGRIYRVGQASDAMFRYMNTGTNWERWTFAGKIAERAGTAENLAMGEQARTIRLSFIDAFNNADTEEPSVDDGRGGKAADRATNTTISEFEKAKTHYYAQQQNTRRRDQRQGTDYYATPEPIGFKMVQFANLKTGEKALEPSAGHGAIARYFPEQTSRTLIEPSSDLASRAALNSVGSRVVQAPFENFDVVNKFDAIVMNPPYGSGGKTAIEHVAKAARHLRNGGRIVALLPHGGTATKRYDDFMESVGAASLHEVYSIELPSVTFERAGTGVMTVIKVLEKQTDATVRDRLQGRRISYTGAETVEDLFDRIEGLEVSDRLEPLTKDIDIPTSGEVTVNEVNLNLRSDSAGSSFLADFVGFIGTRYRAVVQTAEAAGGAIYHRNGKVAGFTFANEAARTKFLQDLQTMPDEVAQPPSEGGGDVSFTMGETKHTKTGEDLFVATINGRVEKDVYSALNTAAKRHGGWYSSFRGAGAIVGFQFKSAEARKAFLDETAGGLREGDDLPFVKFASFVGMPSSSYIPLGGFTPAGAPLGKSAADYVIEQGAKHKGEVIVILDGDGTVVADGRGRERNVGWPDKTGRLIAAAGSDLIVHHNHPTSRGFSTNDILYLASPGITVVWAHGNNRQHSYRAAIPPTLRSRVDSDRLMQAVHAAHGRAGSVIYDGFIERNQRRVMAGHPWHDADLVSKLHSHFQARALHDAGVIDYWSSFNPALPDGMELDYKVAVEVAKAAFAEKTNDTVARALPGPDRDTFAVRHAGDVGLLPGRDRAATGNRRDATGNAGPRQQYGFQETGGAQPRIPGLEEPRSPFIDTPEFRRWFGNSKVVDAQGKPLVVYHGTAADFDAFDNRKTGKNDRGLWGRGHYLSSSATTANSYAMREGGGARVIPAYVSLQNPLILKTGSDLITRLPDGRNTRDLIGPNLDGAKIKEIAISAGHDGVLQLKPDGTIGDVVAFSPEQIKSVNNNGTFDPSNPAILGNTGDMFDRGADGKPQLVLPGAERLTDAQIAQRKADAALKAKAPQKDMDFGLFGDGRKQGDLFGNLAEAPPFYSALLRTVEGLKMAKAPASQWISTIKNQQGVKAEELAWLGVEDWLNSQPGAVTKDALAEFIRANQVQVQEVVKGGEDTTSLMRRLVTDRFGRGVRLQDLSAIEQAQMQREWEAQISTEAGGPTKFSSYQLPGGENYREMLLTLPESPAPQRMYNTGADILRRGEEFEALGFPMSVIEAAAKFVDDAGSVERGLAAQDALIAQGYGYTADQKNAGAFLRGLISGQKKRVAKAREQDFRASHWSEPNVLAHVRFNERTADGKRTLFIEEIQSDWHQKGRKKGYSPRDVGKLEARRAEIEALGRNATQEQKQEWADIMNRLRRDERDTDANTTGYKGVPDAPFKTTWPELALKRMVRWAAENGFDQVAWGPGKEQVDRYQEALRKAVDTIHWFKELGGVRLVGSKGNLRVVDTTEKETVLSDAIGKALADQIIADPAQSGTISGDDIRINDTGMAVFYDQMLVNTANKLGKKFGAKVGRSEVPAGETAEDGEEDAGILRTVLGRPPNMVQNYQTAHTLPITPDMRRAAMQGVPLFEAGKFPPTQFVASRKQINAAAAEVERLTQKMLGRKVKTFTNDVMPSFIPPEFIAAYGEHNRTIYITMRAAHDLANNVGHESLHAMRQLGLIDGQEWTALVAMAKKHGFKPTPQSLELYRREYVGRFGMTEAQFTDKIDEESVARLFGNYVSVREKLTPWARKVIDALLRWADAVLVAIGAAGVQVKARDVMAKAYRGDLAGREEGRGQLALDQLAVAGAAQDVTQTPEFKAWFEDSKVVDAKGNPLVVYHGTNSDITVFSKKKLGSATKARSAKLGFFFADDADVAGSYANRNNPYDLMAEGENGLFLQKLMEWSGGRYEKVNEAILGIFGKSAIPKGQNVLPVFLKIKNPAYMDLNGEDYRDQPLTAFMEKAIAAGHDGVIIREVVDPGPSPANGWAFMPSTHYVVFEPTQIKSVFNGGKFDPSNPMILGNAGDTSAPAFKRWFGDSKVVDAKGAPLVAYRGMTHPMNRDAFVPREGGTYGDGIYLSTDKEVANFWANPDETNAPSPGDAGTVYPVYVSLQNPAPGRIAEQIEEEATAKKVPASKLFRERGYDGVYTEDGEIVVFEPTQIKSAIGNSGTFDPSNPSILGNTPDGSGSGGGSVPPAAVAVDAAAQDELAKYAASINLHRINTSDDIKRLIAHVADEAGNFIGERRGKISHEQTVAMAEELGLTEKQLLSRKSGDAWNNAYIFAARTLLIKSGERVLKLAERAGTSNSTTDLAEALRAVQRHLAIQEQVSGLATEAGRALDQFNIMAAKDFGTALDQILRGARTNKSTLAAKMGGEEALAHELVSMIAQLKDPSKVSEFIGKAYKATFWDMVREFWVSSLLSGPKTIIVNLIGNVGVALWQVPTTAVAASISTMRGGPNRVRMAEINARMSGLVAGSWEGMRLAGQYFMTGESSAPITKLDNHKREAIPGALGYLVRTPLRAMEAGDQFFKEVNRRAELHALAVRMALEEQRTGADYDARVAELVDKPSIAMQRQMRDAALYGTFQRDLGPVGRMVMNLREVIPGAWLIIPFIKTGVNLGKFAVEHSPLALASLTLPNSLKSVVASNLRGDNGRVAQDTQIAKIAMGTGMIIGVVSMVAAGVLTGGGPDDWEEKQVWLAAGNQPYSIKIGGTWYSYQRFDPFALLIGVTADFVEASEGMASKQIDEIAAILMHSIANVTTEKSWFKGPADFFDAFFSKTSSQKSMERYVQGIVSSMLVPSLVNQVGQYVDPVWRETNSMAEKIRSRLPYKSQSLMPRRNIFGEELRGEGSFGPDLLSPIWTTTVKDNKLANELLELQYFPSLPNRIVNGHKLTPEQFDRYVELSGKQAVKTLEKRMTGEAWRNFDPDKRIEKIRDAFNDARDDARKVLKREWPELRHKAEDN